MSQPKSQNEEFKSDHDQTISEAREKEREREREREREIKESSGRKEETKGSPCLFQTTSLIRKKLAWPDEVCQSCYTLPSLACRCSPPNNGTRSI